MRIDKEKLKALTMLPDDELWKTIHTVASSYGIKTPEAPPPACEMEKIKAALRDADRGSISSAMRIVDKYRKGKS